MIPVWDYRREYEAERDDLLGALEAVFRSGTLILGEQVRGFEAAFAAACGASHGVGVNSGTDAIVVALRALGVGPGDEVLTVANTAIPTVSAIVAAGAVPRFVDVDPQTLLMDPSRLEAALTPRTRCILPVHLYGQCADMRAIGRVAAARGLRVLEDCAQCHGASQQGRVAGSLADAAAFSFYPTKVLGAYGDAGMVVTSDRAVADLARSLRMYGTEGRYFAERQGYNSRLDEMQAALLARKLARLPAYIARRREIARIYDERLAGTGLALPRVAPGNTHVYYAYVCRHPARDRIVERLAARGVQANVSYRWPVHRMPAYASLGYAEGSLPQSEAACREVFSLPMYPTLGDEEAVQVCDALREVLAREL